MGRLFYSRKVVKLEKSHLSEEYKNKSELPKHLRLDLSTVCQLKCPSCYMRQEEDAVKNGCKIGNMKFENFKKLVDENNIEDIEISNSGEIFLNPDLVKILEYAHKKHIRLTADNGVNLNNLTEEQAEALVKYELASMTISLDGASQETYSKYRIGGDYNKVIENIEKINKYKNKYKNGCPHIVWKFIVFGHNEHEIPRAKKEAKRLKLEMKFDANWDPKYSPVKDKEMVIKETNIQSLDVNVSPCEQLKEFEDGDVDWFFCRDLWDGPQINWDGQILGCCANFKENFGGNAFKDGLLNALNNPKMIYAKNMVTNNAKPAKDIPCSRCWVYRDMYKNNKWLKSPKNESKK